MDNDDRIQLIAEKVLILSEQLIKIDGIEPNNLWPLLPERDAPEHYLEAKNTTNEIISLVREANDSMLSDITILNLLLFNTAALRLQFEFPDKEILAIANNQAAKLLIYKARRQVNIPIISLDVGSKPFDFGFVTFLPVTLDDKQSDWWMSINTTLKEKNDFLFISYASVEVIGDQYRAIDEATMLVRESLLQLRGIGFPIIAKEIYQIGILNEFPVWGYIPYQCRNIEENAQVDSHSTLITRIGPPQHQYRLQEDILNNITEERLAMYLRLLSLRPNQINVIANKILSGFRWLGEATKPDVLNARFSKLAFALEAFIGGEGQDRTLPTIGISASLAERAAFLIGTDLQNRKLIDKKVREYYSKRSGISHGRSLMISEGDFEDFGKLVREIGWALLDKEGEIININGLQNWVVDKKYSI